jgi:hypothetical protein
MAYGAVAEGAEQVISMVLLNEGNCENESMWHTTKKEMQITYLTTPPVRMC